MDRPVAELRRAPHSELGKLTLGKIVDHYAAIIAALPEKPILIGHSYGGLFGLYDLQTKQWNQESIQALTNF